MNVFDVWLLFEIFSTAKCGGEVFLVSGKVSSECKDSLNYPVKPGGNSDVDNYIVANVQQYGFYRVNYDLTNWNRIITALNEINRVSETFLPTKLIQKVFLPNRVSKINVSHYK